MTKEKLLTMLKDHLRIVSETTSEYTGSLGNGETLYKDVHRLKLYFADELIDEVYLG